MNMIKLEKILKLIKRIIKKTLYYGKKYHCNICESDVRIMKPYGIKHEIFKKNSIVLAGYRKYCKCPVCKSKDRLRLVYYYLIKYTDIFTNENKVLHIAPESLLKEKLLKNDLIKYYDGDLKKGNASFILDITDIPFKDNIFDYIICNQVLEHVVNEKKALYELKRVIKPDGRIIITVPICISNENTLEDDSIVDAKERLSLFCQEDHVRLYGLDFKERMEKYGFKVIEYNIDLENNNDEIKKYSLPKNGLIYILYKK